MADRIVFVPQSITATTIITTIILKINKMKTITHKYIIIIA